MKKQTILSIAILSLITGLFVSCADDDSIGESQITIPEPELTDLDNWLRDTYTYPYNIEVIYEWSEAEVDLERYLYPPDKENVQPAMEAVEKIWIESYSEIGGEDFVKKIAPRQLLLVGGVNLNQSGTITLGVAEGGKRITFFNVDLLDFNSPEIDINDPTSIGQFIHTIQHEYVHILNQTKTFNEQEWLRVTPENYTGQWFNETIEDSRELGYITAYARSNEQEDFAEMVSNFLIYSNDEWNDIIDDISSEQAREDIRTKEQMMVDYYDEEFDLDLYELQERTQEKLQEVIGN